MADIKSPKLIWIKGWLFLGLGVLSAGLILIETPSLRMFALLSIAIWAFSRFYYFAFYVIQNYVDPSFRFAGLWDFCKYAIRKQRDS